MLSLLWFISLCCHLCKSCLMSYERSELHWIWLTSAYTGGNQRIDWVYDLSEIGTNMAFWKCRSCLYGMKGVFAVYSLWVWQRTGFSAISSTGSLNEQLFLVGSHQFLVDYFWNSKRQQQSFLLPLTKGCLFLQNVSSISVVRIRVFFPAHEKLGDFKGFPSLLQDSFKKSDLWSLWPKKRNVYQINSYLSFRWVKMLYLPFDILQTASLFRLKWRRSCF